MKTADWIGVGVLVTALGVGGFMFATKRGPFSPAAGAPLAGGPSQYAGSVGVQVAPTPAATNNTANDVKAAVDIAKTGVGVLKDLFATFESFTG